MRIEVEPFGDAALRARLPADVTNPAAILAALRAHPRVVDAVVTERHALVTFDPAAPPVGVGDLIAGAQRSAELAGTPREHVVRVRYDGEDLDEVARALGCAPEDVAARHAAGRYTVAAIGFVPGFAYLRGLDPRLIAPRRRTPRPRIPPLSVAIAGPYTGIYPFASPGGWSLLGTARGFVPFDARTGAALALGDRVTFVEERVEPSEQDGKHDAKQDGKGDES